MQKHLLRWRADGRRSSGAGWQPSIQRLLPPATTLFMGACDQLEFYYYCTKKKCAGFLLGAKDQERQVGWGEGVGGDW